MTFLPLRTVNGAAAVIPDPISAAVDAFQRTRISQPYTLFDAQFHFDKAPLVFDESATGGAAAATFNANANAVDLTLGIVSGESIIRQTYQRYFYQPGKSQLIVCTGLFGAPKNNVRKRVGYFTASNGVFLESNSTTVAFVIRTSTSGAPVDTVIPQAAWNVDKMDGTGPSGITIDLDSTQIFAVDLEWLGVGVVRFGFVIDGQVRLCHRVQNANAGLTVPYMQRASLPIRYEIVNTGVPASGTTLRQICHSVVSEGGSNPNAIIRSADNFGLTVGNGLVQIPLVSIRLKAAAIDSIISPQGISVVADAGEIYRIQIIRNTALTGAVWTSAGADSIAEFDISATAVTGGTVTRTILSGGAAAPGNFSVEDVVNLGASIAGVADIFTLTIRKFAGGGTPVGGAINWKELQ